MLFRSEAFWPANLSAPGGWLKEDGAAISRTIYSDLFSIIGTTYGIGDGSTTFNLPTVDGGIIRYIPWTTFGEPSSIIPLGATVALRTNDGRLKAAEPIENDDLVTKQWIIDYINSLP